MVGKEHQLYLEFVQYISMEKKEGTIAFATSSNVRILNNHDILLLHEIYCASAWNLFYSINMLFIKSKLPIYEHNFYFYLIN